MLFYRHKAWLGEHKLKHAKLAFMLVAHFAQDMCSVGVALRPTLCSHVCMEPTSDVADDITDECMEVAADDADKHTEVKSGSDSINDDIKAHSDEGMPINKHDFEDGLRRDTAPTELRTGLPKFKVRKSEVNKFAWFIPEHWRKFGMLNMMEPWRACTSKSMCRSQSPQTVMALWHSSRRRCASMGLPTS